MSLFDTLEQRLLCPYCTRYHQFSFEFRYGSCALHKYREGDEIRWDRYPTEGPRIDDNAIVIGLTIPECVDNKQPDDWSPVLYGYIVVHDNRVRQVYWSTGDFEWIRAERELCDDEGLPLECFRVPL
ncbi:MAG: hypothetical protein U0269_19620 [Polyangiales bacterium]